MREKASFDLGLIRWLLGFMKPYRLIIILAIFLLVIAKAIEAYVPIYLGQMVDNVLGIFQGDSFSILKTKAFYAFALIFGSALFEIAVVWLKNYIGQKSLFQLRQKVYRHILSLPISYFDKHSVGGLMTRTIHDVDQINQMFAEGVVPIFGSLILFIAVLIGSFLIDIRAAILLWLLAAVVFLLTNYFRLHQRRLFDQIRTVVSKMNGFIQEHLMGAATVTSFGLESEVKEGFEELNVKHCETYKETIHYYSFFFASLDFLQGTFLIAMFGLLAIEATVTNSFDAGTFFSFSLYALMLFRPLVDLADRYNLLQSSIAAGKRLKKLLEEPIEANAGDTLNEITSINFQNVYFAYEGDDYVLKDFSLTLKKGESLAICGLTGAGKTTILNLLLRFYDYNKGSILINGKEIRSYNLASLRAQFSVVLQEQFSSQKELSVGEKQLFAIKETLKTASQIFFLDEATANIDTRTEKMIQKELHKLIHERTSIIIAHRLSTIRDVDRIIVMEEGRVVEEGSFHQLIQQKGRFEKLYRLQFTHDAMD